MAGAAFENEAPRKNYDYTLPNFFTLTFEDVDEFDFWVQQYLTKAQWSPEYWLGTTALASMHSMYNAILFATKRCKYNKLYIKAEKVLYLGGFFNYSNLQLFGALYIEGLLPFGMFVSGFGGH